MNWKEVPHLFSNGKFKVTTYTPEFSYILTGIDYAYDNEKADLICEDCPMDLDDAKLIARPISDMSDKEKEIFLQRGIHHNDDIIFETLDTNNMVVTAFLYLLSIGVYPFDQNNPKDVIWRYENEL